MPATKQKSGLMGKVGLKLGEAVNAHKGDETVLPSGGGLPGGIENGIAQVVMCKFDTYKTGELSGEFYFLAQATVILPEVHGKIPVRGLRTSIGPEPICDTPGRSRDTLDKHVAWVLNEMRKLGVDTKNLGAENLESAAAAIEQTAPYTRFRTWQGDKQVIVVEGPGKVFVQNEKDGKGRKGPYKDEAAAKAANPFVGQDPRVNEQWSGIAVDFHPETTDGVVDETGTGAHASGNGQDQEPWVKDSQQEGQATAESTDDVGALVAAAEGGDEAAMRRLGELAMAAGHSEEEVNNAQNWAEVASLIGGGGDEGKPADPEVGTIWFYKASTYDAKTKKTVKAKKATEHEVLTVDANARTVTLKSSETGKTVIAPNKKPLPVSWDELEQGE